MDADHSNVRNALLKRQIESFSRHVSSGCRNSAALQDAKELVPLAQLVQDNLDILEGDYQDNLLPHLVKWYSEEFFAWFNPPDCEKCNSTIEIDGCSTNLEGNSVENYKCTNTTCDFKYDFIRHNDPAILIHTRKGRCGEKANCFMLFLRALDYEARTVLDTTDHVWNEAWSESQQRWLHIDPCEGVIDTPLLYELGWKKKLEYCIAFGQYEAIDVTRRYSSHYEATLSRRKSNNEPWLSQYLDELTYRLSSGLPETTREKVFHRRNTDLTQLAMIPTGPRSLPQGHHELRGRETGSLSWRIARGEFNPMIKNSVIIKCDNISVGGSDNLFELSYTSLSDSYKSSSNEYEKKGWSSLTYSSENLDYKYEKDWRTSYVARYESCPAERSGKLQWRFDVSNLDWTHIEIFLDGKIYTSTTISLILQCYEDPARQPNVEIKLSLCNTNRISRNQLKSKVCFLDLIAELSGGDSNDEVAWQKPQLFRQVRGQGDGKQSFLVKIS